MECQRIDTFELWCGRRFLRVPWTSRRLNQSIRKEISPEYSLKGLMLKLKLQYFGTCCRKMTYWKRPWCRKMLKARREGDNRRSLDAISDSMDVSLSKLLKLVIDREIWSVAAHGFAKSHTQLSDWTELSWTLIKQKSQLCVKHGKISP